MRKKYNNSSRVEELARLKSGQAFQYPPTEKIRVLVVPDFSGLGRLTALRFIEWLGLNPEGVVSLPTGKTPEHFIAWTAYFLEKWHRREVKRELARWGIDRLRKPDMRAYVFTQIDEFYPMDPRQENSFAYYIKRFYFQKFGFDPRRALLMDAWRVGVPAGGNLAGLFSGGAADLSLRYRQPENERERRQARAITAMDQYAQEYEDRIRANGGIGFFLGGIGPDGHIGFNIRGAGFHSTTRLDQINYETAAAAAADLGGIEIARRKLVLTIGLETITWNPKVTALITAAGESKARVVRDAVENAPSILYPASVLQGLPGSAFYLTRGTADFLTERRREKLRKEQPLSTRSIEETLIDTACRETKMLVELQPGDIETRGAGRVLAEKGVDVAAAGRRAADRMVEKIRRGTEPVYGTRFLHTAPHHDDIMLGYLPYIVHLVRDPSNAHYFATMTSGFTSVTNDYASCLLLELLNFIDRKEFRSLAENGYFEPGNILGSNRDIYQYLDGVAAARPEMCREAESRRMMRNLAEIAGTANAQVVRSRVNALKRYFQRVYPGKKDSPLVQKLKGMIREWEEELLWGHLGFSCEHIFHLRLGFYTGDIFTEQPRWDRDVMPMLKLMEKVQPDVVTVALDPEGNGPDTHFKALLAVAGALEAYQAKPGAKEIRVLGYRNVWYRFHPAEANVYVPLSMTSLAIMKNAFHTCFGSQRSASFPSHDYDGPFCDLAQRIMVEQYATVKTCLGRDFFYRNMIPRLRASRGMNFLREMTSAEFLAEVRQIRESAGVFFEPATGEGERSRARTSRERPSAVRRR